MKKITFHFLSTLLFLFLGSNVWAADELFYTLKAVKNETNNNAYANYYDVTYNSMDWSVPGNQTLGDFWRIGGKSLENVDRFITAKSAMGSVISRVVLNHNGVSRNTVTINSLTLTVASDAEFATILDQVTITPTIGLNQAGNAEFIPSTEFGVEWPVDAFYKLAINVTSTTTSNGGLDVTSIEFYAPLASTGVNEPTFSPAGGTYAGAVTVTISADEDCYILYTTDGTDPQVSMTATMVETNTTTVEVTETTTIRAYALYMGANMSNEASATYTILKPITSIGALCAAATDAREPVLVEFNNWFCTGVAGSNVYFTDGKNGILLYQSGNGFEVGDELTGTARITLTMYNECPEIMGLTTTTEGLTVTKGGEGATPMVVVIADLEKDMQGNLITLEGVTYNASGKVFVDDDDNTIVPYNRFVNPLPELVDGKTYNVTGVAIWYKNNQIWEIAPRTEEEFVLLTSQTAPESYWSVESETVDVNDTPTAVFTTDSDGEVTYESSNEDVATIDENGVITPVGKGTTIITAFVAETETYLPDSKSFKLTVTVEGYTDVTFAYNDADIAGQGAPDTGAELTATRNDVLTLYANKAYAKEGDTHIKFYGSKYEEIGEDEEKEKVLTEPSFIELSVVDGYAITEVVLTATGEGYIKEWKDQFGTDAVINGVTATLKGEWGKLILTNQATSQARIKTIAVTYIDTNIIDAISLTPALSEGNGAIYNLAGQRLSKMQKGINIVNGKKVLK